MTDSEAEFSRRIEYWNHMDVNQITFSKNSKMMIRFKMLKEVFFKFKFIDLCCSDCYFCIASLSPVQLRTTQSKLSIHFIQSESKLSKRFILRRFKLEFDLSNSTFVQTVVELSRRFDRQISKFGQKIADKKCGWKVKKVSRKKWRRKVKKVSS